MRSLNDFLALFRSAESYIYSSRQHFPSARASIVMVLVSHAGFWVIFFSNWLQNWHGVTKFYPRDLTSTWAMNEWQFVVSYDLWLFLCVQWLSRSVLAKCVMAEENTDILVYQFLLNALINWGEKWQFVTAK